MSDDAVSATGSQMAIQWSAVGKVVVAVGMSLGFAKFGRDVSQRVDSLQQTFVQSRDIFARQVDKTTEALPWERQLRMLDALTTDCDAVAQSLAKQDCLDARRKLVGQVETMRKALGASQTVLGEWQVRVTVEDTAGRPFVLPMLGLIEVLLPNLATVGDSTNSRVVEAEVGRRQFLAVTDAGAVEARRPVTNGEADSIVRDAAQKALRALDLEVDGVIAPADVRADPEWGACVKARDGNSDASNAMAQRSCASDKRERDFVKEFSRAVRAYSETVGASTTAKGLGSFYSLTRPYDPYGPKPHTVVAMALAEFEKLGPLGDSLFITLRVHKSGQPDSLFPGSSPQTFRGSVFVRDRNIRWRQDKRGLAWGGGVGLVPRDAQPLTVRDIEVAQANADSLAQILQGYGPGKSRKP